MTPKYNKYLRLLEHPDANMNKRVVRISEDTYVLEMPRYRWEESKRHGPSAKLQYRSE